MIFSPLQLPALIFQLKPQLVAQADPSTGPPSPQHWCPGCPWREQPVPGPFHCHLASGLAHLGQSHSLPSPCYPNHRERGGGRRRQWRWWWRNCQGRTNSQRFCIFHVWGQHVFHGSIYSMLYSMLYSIQYSREALSVYSMLYSMLYNILYNLSIVL